MPMNRPLAWAAVAYALGCAAGNAGWYGGYGFPLVLLCLGGGALAGARRLPYGEVLVVALLFAGAGGLLWQIRQGGPHGDPLSSYARVHPNVHLTLFGRVRTAPVLLPGDDYATFTVDVQRAWCGDKAVVLSGRTRVAWSEPVPGLRSGDWVTFSGTLQGRLGPVNHGIHDAEDYLRSQGIFTRVRVRGNKIRCTGTQWWRPGYWASCLRQWEATALYRAVPPTLMPFLRAVWLGDRGAVDPDLRRALRDSGTAHILTVSGVHVGIVALCLGFVLSIRVRSRKRRALLIMAGVITFALASGARPSSLRAALMVCTYLTADLFGRERDAPTALALAALVLLTGRPGLIGHSGFILSFSCVASILVFAQPLRDRFTLLPRWSRGVVAASLGVSVLAWPLSAAFFHVLPLLGPVANLLVVPLVTVVLWLCLMTVLCSTMLPVAAPLFGHALQPFAVLVEMVSRGVAAVPFGHFNVSPPSMVARVCWGLAAMALYKALHVKARARRWLSASALALVLALVTWGITPRPGAVFFLDVGQSDAAFVRTPGGTTLLIDAGDSTQYIDMGERVVAPFLRAQGVRRIDYAVLSHPDRDHIGGFFFLLKTFPIGTFILSPQRFGTRLEDELLAACKARGVPVRRVAPGDRLNLAGATAEVLHPPPGWGEELPVNQRSVVLRVEWPGVSVLFTGDLERTGETVLARYPCHADILKVPHHGSHTSSSAVLLDAVRPRFAVCSTTRMPQYIMDRYRKRDINLLRTDYIGGVRVTVEGGEPVFLGARQARGYSLAPVVVDGAGVSGR